MAKRDKFGRFLTGWIKGEMPEYVRNKISESRRGDKNPSKRPKVREKISNTLKGNIPWNKDKKTGLIPKSVFKKGNIPWNRGKKGLQKAWNKDKKCPNISRGLIGRKLSKKSKEKMSKSAEERFKIIENHPNWRGGKSFEPYGLEFNKKLKQQIRERDNFTCRECGFTQEQLRYKLIVHHIDFNKKNNNPNNLISLCRNCHSQTNYNRIDWINYYQNKIVRQLG